MKLAEIAFFTDNLAGMVGFYRELLQAEPLVESEGMAIFMAGETRIFLHKNYQPEPGGLPPENHKAFRVKHIDESCADLASRGITLELEPRDYYWGRSAYLRDPDGHLIELHEGED